MSEAFFHADRGPAPGPSGAEGTARPERLVADIACTGPWRADAMHGGPPCALLVRAAERAARAAGGADLVALRTSVDFLGPVPVGPVEVRAEVLRPGRRITLVASELVVDGVAVLSARTWLLRTTDDDVPGHEDADAAADPSGRPPAPNYPPPEHCPPAMTDWAFPYALAMEWRHVSGDPTGPGPAAAWARPRRPLVAGEELTGLQRAVLVADSGNGISAALDWDRWSFVNVDLVVHLSRELTGDWVLLDARTRYEPGGTGLATSVLSDVTGPVGCGVQTLLVSARP